jgi:hypothetical protein
MVMKSFTETTLTLTTIRLLNNRAHQFTHTHDSLLLEKPVCIQFTHCLLYEHLPICGKTVSAKAKEKWPG